MVLRGIYYGWIVALALLLLSSVNNSGSFAFGMFLIPLTQQFGVDRATLALAPTLNRWLAGLLQPFGGYLADRLGPRAMALLGASLFGVSMLTLAFAHNVILVYLSYGLIGGIGLALTGGGTSARIIGAWFRRRRAVAMALASGGVVVGQFVIVPIITLVLLISEWRLASVALAMVVLLIIVPIAATLVRNTPAEKGLRPDDGSIPDTLERTKEVGLPLSAAMRHRIFWQLAFGLIACGVTMSFPNNHLMAFTMDMGISPMTASEAIGIAGLLALPGSLALGFLGDRVGHQRTLAVAYFLRAVTYTILLEANQPGMILVAGLVLGLSWGATVPLTATVAADVFGTRSLATIVSIMTALMYLASGTFTYLAGLDYDLMGNYNLALIFALAMGALACVVCAQIPRQNARPTELAETAAV